MAARRSPVSLDPVQWHQHTFVTNGTNGNRYGRVKRFRSLPSNGQGVNEDDDYRMESLRVGDLSASLQTFRLLVSV